MSKEVVTNLITRIESHLRIEAKIEGGTIKNTYGLDTMARGIESIIKDQDPRNVRALASRVYGVRTSIHLSAPVQVVENAWGIVIPPSAGMIRNIIQAVLYVHDHTVYSYQLYALDWVDMVSVLEADPKTAALLI